MIQDAILAKYPNMNVVASTQSLNYSSSTIGDYHKVSLRSTEPINMIAITCAAPLPLAT